VAGGNLELANDLFDAFMEDLPSQFHELQRLVNTGGWSELRDTAHRVRGSTSYCGVPALNRAVQRLEQAAKAQDANQVAAALSHVQWEVERLRELSSAA
jgi:two-component system sensor histidine kinase BarA